MTKKKVDFGLGKSRTSHKALDPVDELVQERRENTDKPQREQVRRITLDLPVSLHRAFRHYVATMDTTMANVLREYVHDLVNPKK